MIRFKRFLQGLRLVLTSILLIACSDNAVSPQDEIRHYILTAETAAEARDSSALAELIDEQYSDQKNLNKRQLTGLLRGYFLRNRNIHLFTQIESIELLPRDSAFVVLHVAMTANHISTMEQLSGLRANVYRIELSLMKDDDWQLKQSRWQSARLEDMF